MKPSPIQWQFVASDLDVGDVGNLEPWFQKLLERPLDSPSALEQWLIDESELMSLVGAALARRYVAMTCDTENEEKKQAYLAFEQDVMPRVKVLSDQLDRHFLASPAIAELDQDRYHVLIRQRRTHSEIFRPQNTELQQHEAELQTRQQAIAGSTTVEFDGKTLTLQQMAPYYESQDRAVREQAWRAALAARSERWPDLEDIFDKMIGLRTSMANNAGFDNYTPYRFLELGRFDYTAEDCMQLHAAVEQCVVPAVEQLDASRMAKLGLSALRPWDLEVDPEGRPPHRPFETQPELEQLARRVFDRIDPRFAADFDVLAENSLLDLMSRKGKAPGGYQYQLEDVRLPFIFANGVGVHHDMQTLLHEGGHAFHSMLCRDHALLAFRDYPIEFAETASMSMELLGLENLEAAYAPEDARAARRKHLSGLLRILTWICSIDSFQHWLYGNPGHTREERREAWVQIRRRFAPGLDWSGLEDALAMQWIGQGHLFGHAFYYIEYAIAQLASLQIWSNYRRDGKAAVEAYRAACKLGGSVTLPRLFETAGARFDLSADSLQLLVDDVLATIAAIEPGN
jgi:oligoendopeptidase F